jgi:hypothetical protein
MFYDYYLIPVEVSQWVIQNKFFRQFQVYICLKTISDGIVYLDKNLIKHLAKELELKSTKTITKNLKDLEENNWIGIDQKYNKCYVRGFNNIQFQLGMTRRNATIFYKTDISDIKPFLIASVMSNLIRQGKSKKWRKEALIKGKAHQSLRPSTFLHPIANKGLSKILNCSMATASRYKSLASKRGYIDIKPDFEKVKIDKAHIMLNNKYSNMKIYKTKKGIPVIQKPDLVSTNILMRRRRK